MSPEKSPLAGVQPPQASFSSLIEIHLLQTLVFTGKQPNLQTGKRETNLPFAKYNVEMLEMIAAKTEGNRTEEESRLLDQHLHLARLAYVEARREAGEGE